MKTYLIFAQAASNDVSTVRKNMMDLKPAVKIILKEYSGKFIHDGSHYGIAGKAFENSEYILVKTDPEAAAKIREIQGVRNVMENEMSFTAS